MQYAADAPTDSLRGLQEPRIASWPTYTTSAADEVIKVGELAGIHLDPWQKFQLLHGLGESADWKCPHCTYRTAAGPVPCSAHPWADLIHPWSAFEVCSIVPRQNGKSELLIVRMLGGLFVLEEELQIYSAHLFDTALEIFLRLRTVIENTPDLYAEVKRRGRRVVGIKNSHGEEGIELTGGPRVRFKARTGGGGRGFSGDTLYVDEAMILRERFLGATLPILSARPNPQIWLAGSPPDEDDPAHDGVVLAKRRRRALDGDDPSLAYFEHSAKVGDDPTKDDPAKVPKAILDDPREWARANPALGAGGRISVKFVSDERRAMGARQFATERLGIGKWPEIQDDTEGKIPLADWAACLEAAVTVDPADIKPVCFAYDINPERTQSAIGVGGRRADGKWVVAVLKHAPGTDWVVPELLYLAKHRPKAIIWDKKSQANSLADDLTAARVRNLKPIDTRELVDACGRLYDAATTDTGDGDRALVQIGQEMLDEAIKGADSRDLGDAWAWQRRTSTVDITPVVVITLALWGAQTHRAGKPMVAFR